MSEQAQAPPIVEGEVELHDGSEPPSEAEGSMPLLGICLAIAVPVVLVYFAATEESAILVVLAVLAICVGLGALLIVMGRLMADPDAEDH